MNDLMIYTAVESLRNEIIDLKRTVEEVKELLKSEYVDHIDIEVDEKEEPVARYPDAYISKSQLEWSNKKQRWVRKPPAEKQSLKRLGWQNGRWVIGGRGYHPTGEPKNTKPPKGSAGIGRMK